MEKSKMVMFDLSGTTVYDEGYVTGCLYRAARELEIQTTEQEIAENIGTNKRHLYQFLIARSMGQAVALADMGRACLDPEAAELADKAFALYESYMIELYRKEVREVPGAADTFRWLHERDIRVATDTGFHGAITEAIMERLGWLRDGLVDISVCVQDIPEERGRPAPYMIFHAMLNLGITSVREVVKVGDQPVDLLEGYNAGCRGVVGVLSGSMDATVLGRYWHTHIIPSVKDLPELMEREFL
jgi:phosphonatase-like hydrolase